MIVGLGNPGVSYKNTRHNVGFTLLDGIADGEYLPAAEIERSGSSSVRKLFKSRTPFGKASGPYVSTEGSYFGERFLLVKPTTYMNASGRAVTPLVRKGKIRDEGDLLVVVDDVNIPLGSLRLREKGSAGGQKGLKSIIESLGTDVFARFADWNWSEAARRGFEPLCAREIHSR